MGCMAIERMVSGTRGMMWDVPGEYNVIVYVAVWGGMRRDRWKGSEGVVALCGVFGGYADSAHPSTTKNSTHTRTHAHTHTRARAQRERERERTKKKKEAGGVCTMS